MYSSTLALLAGAALVSAVPTAKNEPRAEIDSFLPAIVPVNTRANDADLIAKLITTPRQVDRAKLLNEPGDYVFDFADTEPPEGSAQEDGFGGASVAANSKSMPALIGTGSSMTVAFLGPCGMNTAHVHPRATELNIIVKGRLVTNFIIENGLPLIANTMDTFQMSVFPQGAIHQEFNPDCEEAVFVASFNNEDPGVSEIAHNFNGADIDTFRSQIPDNIALGIDACLDKCGIQRNAKRDIHELLPKRK